MKKLFIIIVSIFVLFTGINGVDAGIFSNDSATIPYCNGDECGLVQGIEQIENSDIEGVVTEGTASEYIQEIIVYVLTFLRLAAVILIIYAGFNMLTSAGDEEKAKNSKTMIVFAVIGLAIIFLAGPITTFVLNVFTQTT